VVALFTGAFGAAGGLEMYNRLIVKMLAEDAAAAECEVFILGDTREDVDLRYAGRLIVRTFAGKRWRFAAAAVMAIVRRRPDVIVFGHVHFSILALLFGLLRPRTKRWFVTHGVEVWRPLNRIKSLALQHATVVSSVSDYTRRQVVAKGIDASKTTLPRRRFS
jgi:phosphatidylinositol alpha-1,6-mannosyltransferase